MYVDVSLSQGACCRRPIGYFAQQMVTTLPTAMMTPLHTEHLASACCRMLLRRGESVTFGTNAALGVDRTAHRE